ncbi:SUKH-3 domain-containing protein [Streptomyces sp. NPDC059247]|uniref:SUKH-3 domain-containing protein n=1 Tax=Streptomyces sp. NPDC059247 TaxID=3346790 RepID=UPI0036C1903C
MNSARVPLDRAAAWSRLLETYRPHATDDRRVPPSLGCLIEAARGEATLGAMYPWVSMEQLGVSAGDDWEEWGHTPLPAMFARPDGYSVVGRTQRGDVVRLTTSDPAEAAAFAARLVGSEAVAFAARLVGSEGIARVEKPCAWLSEVETVLRDAGWRPGRVVDTRAWTERLEQDGFRSHAAAECFLREFGELTVGHGGGGITRAREPFDLDPLLALGEADRFAEWSAEIGHHLFPVGELDHGHAFLGLDENGELYVVSSWLARFSRVPEALENLVLGVMPVRMPSPG